jgi:hypothetical protein
MAAKGSMLKGALSKSPKGDGRVTSLPVQNRPMPQKRDAAGMAAGAAQDAAGLKRLSPGVYRNAQGNLVGNKGQALPGQRPQQKQPMPPQGASPYDPATLPQGPATRPPAPLGTPPGQPQNGQPMGPAPLGQLQPNPNAQQFTPNLNSEQFRQMFPQFRQSARDMTAVYNGQQPLDMNAIMAKYQQGQGFDMSQQYDPNKLAITQAAQAGQIPMMQQQMQPMNGPGQPMPDQFQMMRNNMYKGYNR